MVPNDDAWKRLREREEEAEREQQEQAEQEAARKKSGLGPAQIKLGSVNVDSDQLAQMIQQADVLIEQVNNLYGMYFAGVEKRAPQEKRQLLDASVTKILAAPKANPAMQFKSQTLIQKYNTQKDRWDRMLKDLESGKLKRVGIK